MLSHSPNNSIESTNSLCRFNSSFRQLSTNKIDFQTATLQRSPDRYSLYRTSSFSVFAGPHSPFHGCSNTSELDACWGGGNGGKGRTPDVVEPGRDLYEFLKEAQLDQYYSILNKHLKIRSVSQMKYVADVELTEMGMSRPEQRLLKKCIEKECPGTAMGKLKKKLSRSTSARSVSLGRGVRESGEDRFSDAANDSLAIPGHRIIPSSELDVASPLGQGEFGRVHQGSWRPSSGRHLQVAVKILDLEKFPAKMEDFLTEAALMHSLDHPDIVRLHGISVAPKCFKLVTELAPLRSLLECLREQDLRLSFPVSTLHNFACQIARGMSYLEEKRLVHRDLAARNVLVFSKDKVKIGDFGLSRALNLGKSYYQTNFSANLRLPVAWCAPEAIHDLCFTSASDVWSYGVTLWEIFTYGFTPWAGLSGRQILEAVDVPNCQRLEQPEACPDAVFDAVMRACWNHEPESRPTFDQLTEMLPRLSPQAWSVVVACEGNDDLKTVDDIHNLLNSSSVANEDADAESGYEEAVKPLLSARLDEIVYVISKRYPELWKVISKTSGRIGYVPSRNLRLAPSEGLETPGSSKSPHGHQSGTLSRMRLRFSKRESSSRSGRGTAGPVKLRSDLISRPQNDFRHVGHLGADGAMFGDVGFMSVALGDDQDRSPTESCLAIESNSDKENPRLSDITLSEQRESPVFDMPTRKFEAANKLPSRHPNKVSPLGSPTENQKSLLDATVPYAPSTNFMSSGGGEEQSSLFDMGTSFMDEIFSRFTMDDSKPVAPAKDSPPLRSSVAPPADRTPSIFSEVEIVPPPSRPTGLTDTVNILQSSPSPSCEKVTRSGLDLLPNRNSPAPTVSSSASSSAGEGTPRRSFVSSTLTRALRKSSVPRKTASAINLDEAGSTDSRIPPRKSKEDRRSSTSTRKPLISGPVVISGPIIMGTQPSPSMELPVSTASSRTSRGSSLTMISAATSGNSGGCTPRMPYYNHASPSTSDVKSSSLTHPNRSVAISSGGQNSQSSYSTTPSISPAPSLSSINTNTSSRDSGNGGALRSTGMGLRVLGGKDAVFRASGNVVGGTGRRRQVNSGQAAHFPASSASSNSVGEPQFDSKSRLSVSDATPHVSLPNSSTALAYNRFDSSGNAPSRSSIVSTDPYISTPPSTSSLESGASTSACFSNGPENGTTNEARHTNGSPLTKSSSSTTNATSDANGGQLMSEDLLSFWGSEFASFLSGQS